MRFKSESNRNACRRRALPSSSSGAHRPRGPKRGALESEPRSGDLPHGDRTLPFLPIPPGSFPGSNRNDLGFDPRRHVQRGGHPNLHARSPLDPPSIKNNPDDSRAKVHVPKRNLSLGILRRKISIENTIEVRNTTRGSIISRTFESSSLHFHRFFKREEEEKGEEERVPAGAFFFPLPFVRRSSTRSCLAQPYEWHLGRA